MYIYANNLTRVLASLFNLALGFFLIFSVFYFIFKRVVRIVQVVIVNLLFSKKNNLTLNFHNCDSPPWHRFPLFLLPLSVSVTKYHSCY